MPRILLLSLFSYPLFFDFLFFMRIQELRELSFKLSYLPLVYPTFFLCVFRSHRSFRFGGLKGRDADKQNISGKILPEGLEIFSEIF